MNATLLGSCKFNPPRPFGFVVNKFSTTTGPDGGFWAFGLDGSRNCDESIGARRYPHEVKGMKFVDLSVDLKIAVGRHGVDISAKVICAQNYAYQDEAGSTLATNDIDVDLLDHDTRFYFS